MAKPKLHKALCHIGILRIGSVPDAGPRNAIGSASDSRARDPGFDTRSDHILSIRFPLIQEGQLSVTGESMCTFTTDVRRAYGNVCFVHLAQGVFTMACLPYEQKYTFTDMLNNSVA